MNDVPPPLSFDDCRLRLDEIERRIRNMKSSGRDKSDPALYLDLIIVRRELKARLQKDR